MKKFLFLSAASLAVSVTVAQPRSRPGTSQNATWDRFWFSVAYTPKFLLSESVSLPMSLDNEKPTTHSYTFEAGYRWTRRFSLGVGTGYERYWLETGGAIDMVPLYLHGEYFYGKHGYGVFNYARMGALLYADAGARTGFTGGIGVGYRLKITSKRFGIDLKLGYDYSGASVNGAAFVAEGFRSRNWSRHSLSLGVGLLFCPLFLRERIDSLPAALPEAFFFARIRRGEGNF